jgi:hypothetical protein
VIFVIFVAFVSFAAFVVKPTRALRPNADEVNPN